MSQTVSARIFAVKTTGGQEKTVAKFVGDRLEQRKHEGKKDSLVYLDPGTRGAEETTFSSKLPMRKLFQMRFLDSSMSRAWCRDTSSLQILKNSSSANR